ncbi:thermonuclease family protein [Nitratireductor soli]|uniref:thermonuclease family protein n=1 Tax=Nitratireductor soli TaxID=1670619 RepID=UPI00065E66D9|nr:thermonuclease family protein [Nitratireductor soli]
MRVGCGVFATVVLAAGANSPAWAQERRAPRIIAPELIAPPPVDPSTLNRLTPRAPLSDLAGPAPEPKIADTLYFRPVAVAAGMVEAEGRTITIAGIRIIAPDRVCDAAAGGAWPCGKQARTAFRYWLRGRALECHAGAATPEAEKAAPDTPLQCTLAGYDVGRWLVENGWALAEPDGPYQDEAEAARQTRKGIFSGGPSAL